MEQTARTITEQLVRWAIHLTGILDSWDTTLLIALAIILAVTAGVTGRAIAGEGLARQILWITVTVILTLLTLTVAWTIASRYLPIPEITGLLQRMAEHKPLLEPIR
ncbi:hypothetical protein [Bifidobacterium saguini]|uniref:hypothetical protein n=1 Tax=Bifidobacterium saguini TaxID=762210 RepID=UPI00053B0239|nr:hypothetical protein [Bifidobacterium saguini]